MKCCPTLWTLLENIHFVDKVFVDTFVNTFFTLFWTYFVDTFCGHFLRSFFVDTFCVNTSDGHFLWTLFADISPPPPPKIRFGPTQKISWFFQRASAPVQTSGKQEKCFSPSTLIFAVRWGKLRITSNS